MSDNEARGFISRRSVLKCATAGVLLAGSRRNAQGAKIHPPIKAGTEAAAADESFRFVHMTDMHVEPDKPAERQLRHAMTLIHELRPRPDFILTGGDLVHDVLAATVPRAKVLFDLYTSIMDQCEMPVYECVGNHDILGWTGKGKVAPDHPSYGRRMVQERLNLPSTYYSFDHKGWHFVVLDDTLQAKYDTIEAGIDEAQLAWLEDDLRAKPATIPTVVCAHIPIISVAPLYSVKKTYPPGRIVVPSWIKMPSWRVCRNAGPILQLLRRHRLPLVLVGHAHQLETITYLSTIHINDGSVCCMFNGVVEGYTWNGRAVQERPGFGVIDVYPAGTFKHYYQECV